MPLLMVLIWAKGHGNKPKRSIKRKTVRRLFCEHLQWTSRIIFSCRALYLMATFSARHDSCFPLSSGDPMNERLLTVRLPSCDTLCLMLIVFTWLSSLYQVIVAGGLEPLDLHVNSVRVFADMLRRGLVIVTSSGRTVCEKHCLAW